MERIRHFCLFVFLIFQLSAFVLLSAADESCSDADADESCLKSSSLPNSQHSEVIYEIEYTFTNDDSSFLPRGKVLLGKTDSDKKLKLRFSDKSFSTPLTPDIVRSIENNGLYRVRIKIPDAGLYILASMNACVLASGQFKEEFLFHLFKSGDIVAFSLSSAHNFEKEEGIDCSSSSYRSHLAQKLNEQRNITFRSKAKVELPKDNHRAPVGVSSSGKQTGVEEKDSSSGILNEKKDELFEDETKKKKETEGSEENQSFLRKYWYIFLPMFLMSIFGGPQDPTQRQPGAAPTANVASTAAASNTATRSGTKKTTTAAAQKKK